MSTGSLGCAPNAPPHQSRFDEMLGHVVHFDCVALSVGTSHAPSAEIN
jgi:hypothetical protein